MSKLTIKDIQVPEGMLRAAVDAEPNCLESLILARVAAALLWLAENPIVPSDDQKSSMQRGPEWASFAPIEYYPVEWQRRMFLKPAVPVPACVESGWRALMAAGLSEADATAHTMAIYNASKEGK